MNSKPMNTEEGNKIISEFMGAERKYESTEQIFIEQLQYHKSWDWLMPVVEKIAKIKIKYSNDSDNYSPYPRTFGMQDEEGNFMVRLNIQPLFIAPTLIEATWLAVVDFIQFTLTHNF